MSQMFVFTGENDYLILEEKRRWIHEFCKKYGIDNMRSINGSDVSIRELLDEVSVMPFLAERRLIIIHGMVRCHKEEAAVLFHAIHPNVLVLFIDQKPDKRSSGIKEILSLGDVKEFNVVKGPALLRWIKEYVLSIGARIDDGAMRLLVEFAGDNQGIIAEELNKLSLYAQGKIITSDDVDLLSIPDDEGIIWKITDMLSGGQKDGAMRYAKRMLDRGGDPQSMWAILLSTLKNSVAVYAAVHDGHMEQKDIADASGVHIFAVRSLMQYAKKQNTVRMKAFIEWAVTTDIALKTGSLRTNDDPQQELISAIDAFFIKYP